MNMGIKFLLAAGFQVLCLVGMIGYKQTQYMGGEKVLLEVPRPKDPRSLFSGDYVIITYAINDLNPTKIATNNATLDYGTTVYVSLVKQGDIHVPTAIAITPPKSGLFIKGVVTNNYTEGITVEYGIEQYYVPEGTGLEAERRLRDAQKAWVKIGHNGDAMTVGIP